MQIIVPMSGEGARFKRAGFADPKPLIKVHGKPIIEYVIGMFPGEDDFIFVCREDHVRDLEIDKLLLRLKPSAKIVTIPGHKFGPVYAVAQAYEFIKDDEPVVVNYCDFYMDWDYDDFKKTVLENKCHGCVPAYTGFHPHLLHPENFYASMRVDDNGWMQEIEEKHSFTDDKTLSPQSPGTYYYGSGAILKKYFDRMLERDYNLNGEFYASLVYNLLKEDGLGVFVYDKIPYFCQWGTPEDFHEYNFWMDQLLSGQEDQAIVEAAKERLPSHDEASLHRIIKYWKEYINRQDLWPTLS